MKVRFKTIFLLVVLGITGSVLVSCTPKHAKNANAMVPKNIDIEGHRGARGLYPENTVTAFMEAVKLGVNTLEMDVVISKDNQVVVSHEPWMSEETCTRPDGKAVEKDSKVTYNLYRMSYAEIATFDCGKRGNVKFPLQKAMPEHKPLLSEVITKVEAYIKANGLPPVQYNIEIKSDPADDGLFTPAPKEFTRLVYAEIKKYNIPERIIIQSFDVRSLQELRKTDTTVITSLLVDNADGLETNLGRLGFIPAIYSPDQSLVNEQLVADLQKCGTKLIPWTVNEPNDMKRLIEMGADGIITDYPDKAIKLLRQTPL